MSNKELSHLDDAIGMSVSSSQSTDSNMDIKNMMIQKLNLTEKRKPKKVSCSFYLEEEVMDLLDSLVEKSKGRKSRSEIINQVIKEVFSV